MTEKNYRMKYFTTEDDKIHKNLYFRTMITDVCY